MHFYALLLLPLVVVCLRMSAVCSQFALKHVQAPLQLLLFPSELITGAAVGANSTLADAVLVCNC